MSEYPPLTLTLGRNAAPLLVKDMGDDVVLPTRSIVLAVVVEDIAAITSKAILMRK